jgi:nucleoside 2-deoxyribosyltransferase
MADFITKCNDLKDFDSGAKRDNPEGKGAYELISPIALRRLALVYERGASQKGARNWENGFPMSRCMQSAMRHLQQYIGGLRDEDHLAQSAWNLFAAIHFEEMIEKGLLPAELNDLPNYHGNEGETNGQVSAFAQESTIKQISGIKPKKFYLAHPFDSRYKVREWEEKFEKDTGIEFLNPFYEGNDNIGIESPDTGRAERYEKIDADKLIRMDVEHIKSCDGVVAIIDGSISYGTIQEMVYAKLHGKPVITVVSNGHQDHPWIRHHSKIIVKSLEEVGDAIKSL